MIDDDFAVHPEQQWPYSGFMIDTSQLIANLTVNDILFAYSGKPGCIPGDRGIYRTCTVNLEEATAYRGSNYSLDEVCDTSVKTFLNKVKGFGSHGGVTMDQCPPDFDRIAGKILLTVQYAIVKPEIARRDEQRVYAVYFTKKMQEVLEANGVPTARR